MFLATVFGVKVSHYKTLRSIFHQRFTIVPIRLKLQFFQMRIHGVVLISGANRGIGLELTRTLLTNPNVLRVYAGSRNFDQVEVEFSSRNHQFD